LYQWIGIMWKVKKHRKIKWLHCLYKLPYKMMHNEPVLMHNEPICTSESELCEKSKSIERSSDCIAYTNFHTKWCITNQFWCITNQFVPVNRNYVKSHILQEKYRKIKWLQTTLMHRDQPVIGIKWKGQKRNKSYGVQMKHKYSNKQ
jgi:hypothetical protein